MHRRNYFSVVLAAPLFLATIFAFPLLALAQTQTPPPAAQNATPAPAQATEPLTPYQKLMMDPAYSDWPNLAKYRDADVSLPPVADSEARVVFMGDSITEGWGSTGFPHLPTVLNSFRGSLM